MQEGSISRAGGGALLRPAWWQSVNSDEENGGKIRQPRHFSTYGNHALEARLANPRISRTRARKSLASQNQVSFNQS